MHNAGGLRADIPEGAVTNGHVLDALPFLNTVVEVELTGTQLREVLEQGLTLERGLIQTSGLRGTYDLSRPAGRRLVSIEVGGRPLADARVYRVATNSFVAEGGDLYATFLKTRARDSGRSVAEVVMEAFRKAGDVGPPPGGRLRRWPAWKPGGRRRLPEPPPMVLPCRLALPRDASLRNRRRDQEARHEHRHGAHHVVPEEVHGRVPRDQRTTAAIPAMRP